MVFARARALERHVGLNAHPIQRARNCETPCATSGFVTVTIHWRSGEGREGADCRLESRAREGQPRFRQEPHSLSDQK